jgi:hypothetical protein
MIAKKLNGYKSQDKKFEIYSEYHCIKRDEVAHMLKECDYTCYYCKDKVLMEYGKRDPKQWTLDRIDNTMGHNTNNVLISCLACNLKRRNRTVEKFLFTKQLTIAKVGGTPTTPIENNDIIR